MDTNTILDPNGARLRVGDRVNMAGDPEDTGVITGISELDADYDDELGRAVGVSPRVTVRFDDGVEDAFATSMTIRGWGDYMREDIPWVCDDLERKPDLERPLVASEDPMDADDGLSDPDTYARVMWEEF
jgi:hypothetical protein